MQIFYPNVSPTSQMWTKSFETTMDTFIKRCKIRPVTFVRPIYINRGGIPITISTVILLKASLYKSNSNVSYKCD